jgi:hypothetical protein
MIDFPEQLVIHRAQQSLNIRSTPGTEAKNIRESGTVKNGRLESIFNDYIKIVDPLLKGKYASKTQLRTALYIIVRKLKGEYFDTFSTDEAYKSYGSGDNPLKLILENVGCVGQNVIKYTIDSRGNTIKRIEWRQCSSLYEILTFWNENSDSRYIPDPDVTGILARPENVLTPNEDFIIRKLNIRSQLSENELTQICASRSLMPPPPPLPTSSTHPPPSLPTDSTYPPPPFSNPQMPPPPPFSNSQMPPPPPPTNSTYPPPPGRRSGGAGGKRTRKYKCKNRNRSKHRVRLSKIYNN